MRADNNVSTVSTSFSSNGTVTSNFTQTGNYTSAIWNLDVTWKNSASWQAMNADKGSQVGSGTNPATSIVLTGSSIPGTISSVVVNTSGASSISATVAVEVGGTTFKCNNNNTASLTSSAANYTFTGSGTGNVVLTWSNSSAKAIYIKSVTITYTTGTSYSVTYNAGAGSGTVPTDGTAYYNGSTVTVKERGDVTHATLGFRGWSDGVNTYNPGETFTMGTSNVTLTAVWATKCTFAYDGNESTGGAIPSSGYYADYGAGAKIKVVGNTGNLVKVVGSTPYVWNGWNTADDGSGDTYQEGDSFIIESDVTLYAKWRELATYTLVTSTGDIEPGKHYIIASSKTVGAATAMGAQGSTGNNRVAVDVVVSSVSEKTTKIKITEATGLKEFVISGNGTNPNYYTIYDESISQYLYAASSSSNYLKNQTINDANGKWTITFGASDNAIITAQGSNTHNIIRKNSSSAIFSCYDKNQYDVYLYKKDNDQHITYYSPTTVSSSQTITTPTTIGKGGVLDIGSNALIIGVGGSLTIEDGGQLITTSAVNATIEKNITAASKDIADHWYTIASSVDAPDFADVTNLITDGEYDLYRYDESSFTWQNSKKIVAGNPQFSSFENGRGYLYRKAGNKTIKYVGTINTGDLENYSLSWASTNNDLKGLNLIGNPFPHNIYKGYGGAIDDAKLSDKFYYLENNGTWQVGTYTTAIKPGMGIIVQTNSAGDITIKDNATPATAEHDPAKANNDEIMLTVSNSQHQDVAYAVFGDRYGLKKIEHRSADAPMLYIPQNNRRYAVAMMSDDTKSFNLNFKAMTIGSYTLSYKSKGDFDYVHVIDCLTGEDIDMLQGEYSFIATPGDNENRFIVRLGYMPNNEGTENEIFAYQNCNNILVSGEGELQVFDVTGRMVVTQHVNGVETINVQSQGVYIFKLNEKVQKIVVR